MKCELGHVTSPNLQGDDIYLLNFKSEYPYNKFTVIERILGNLQNSYIETGAHKVRLKLKYSTKNLKSKSKIPNK